MLNVVMEEEGSGTSSSRNSSRHWLARLSLDLRKKLNSLVDIVVLLQLATATMTWRANRLVVSQTSWHSDYDLDLVNELYRLLPQAVWVEPLTSAHTLHNTHIRRTMHNIMWQSQVER